MDSFAFVGGFLLIVGVAVFFFPKLIAGYNTMSKEEKKKINIKKVKKHLAMELVVFGGLALLLLCFPQYPSLRILWDLLLLIVLLVSIVLFNLPSFRDK